MKSKPMEMSKAEVQALGERWALDVLDGRATLRELLHDAHGVVAGQDIVVAFRAAVALLQSWKRACK